MAGAAATFAESMVRLGRKTLLLDAHYKFGSENSPNFLDLYNGIRMGSAAVPGLEGEYLSLDELEEFRSFLQSPLSRQKMQEFLLPEIREINSVIGSAVPASDTIGMLEAIRDYMVTNNDHIQSRGMTLDTTPTGSVTGTGAWYRLTTDEDTFPLECTGAEVKTFTCLRDQTTGANKHAEVFLFEGQTRARDGLQWSGSGLRREIPCSHAKSTNIVTNPSFELGATDDNTALTSTTQLTGWTVTTAASWKTRSGDVDATYAYRGWGGDNNQTLWGLENTASDQISQTLRIQNPGVALRTKRPLFAAVAYKRKSSATGNITLHLGAVNSTAAIGSATNDVWNVLVVAVGDNNWWKNNKELDFDIKIVTASLATGTVVIDDVVVDYFKNLDGTWWVILGGATPFIEGDTVTFTDTDGGTRAINSYYLWRAFVDDGGQGGRIAQAEEIGGWIPAVPDATEITASGGRTLTFANSGSADTITASSGDFDADGYKAGMLVTIAGSSSNNITTGKLASVSALVLTFGSDTSLTNEGPVSATTTLNATASIVDPT